MGRRISLVVLLASLLSLHCGGKTRGTPATESSGGSSTGGAGGGSSSERHRLLAKAGLRASNPDATWGEGRLAVAYLVESRDGAKGIGLSLARSESVADGFEQVLLAEPSARRSLRITSVAGGYALVWLEARQGKEALMLLTVNGAGEPLGPARELAQTDAMQFTLASSRGTLAVAAMERVGNDWAVTLRLVSDSAPGDPVFLDLCLAPSAPPAVAWDGAAFDIVSSCLQDPSAKPALKLVRASESGELLAEPRVLPAQVAAAPCPSLSLSYDRGALSLLYASESDPRGVSFVRLDPERSGSFDPVSLQSALPPGQFALAPTATGWQALSTNCGSQGSQSVAVTQCALSIDGMANGDCRRMPTSSSVSRPSSLVSGPKGALFVYDEYLLRSRPDVFVVPLPNAPDEAFAPTSVVSPVGELGHHSLVCTADTCRLQSFRAKGRFRSEPAGAREHDELGNVETLTVDLASERVEIHDNSRLLPVRTAQVAQFEPRGMVALLDPHAFDEPPAPSELVLLDSTLVQSRALPVPLGTLFVEPQGVRSFTSNASEEYLVNDDGVTVTRRNRRPVYELTLCAGAYYDLDAERRTIYRLVPRPDAESLPFAQIPEGRGWLSCGEGMVCARTTDNVRYKWWCWDHAGRALPGAELEAYDSRFVFSFEVKLGTDLGLARIGVDTPSRIDLMRIRPDGGTAHYELHAPPGLKFDAWTASGDAEHLHLAWNDVQSGDTYLSSWELR